MCYWVLKPNKFKLLTQLESSRLERSNFELFVMPPRASCHYTIFSNQPLKTSCIEHIHC